MPEKSKRKLIYNSEFIGPKRHIRILNNKSITKANILIFIKLKIKKMYFIIIIYNKYFKVINLIYLKFIFIKDYRFLIVFS